MRQQTAPKAPEDLLSATARPSALRRTLRIVFILVLISLVISGAAWLAGRAMSHNDFSRMRRVTTTS